jgi:hypothetical protein
MRPSEATVYHRLGCLFASTLSSNIQWLLIHLPLLETSLALIIEAGALLTGTAEHVGRALHATDLRHLYSGLIVQERREKWVNQVYCR